jgi:hypothetical protein
MIDPTSMALNLRACLGPIVGGSAVLISCRYGGAFWFLVNVESLPLPAVVFSFPETAGSQLVIGIWLSSDGVRRIGGVPYRVDRNMQIKGPYARHECR